MVNVHLYSYMIAYTSCLYISEGRAAAFFHDIIKVKNGMYITTNYQQFGSCIGTRAEPAMHIRI